MERKLPNVETAALPQHPCPPFSKNLVVTVEASANKQFLKGIEFTTDSG